jgi:DNA-binding IclR family transcriptional regulator
MSRLAYETGETINLAVLDQTETLILQVIESAHEFRMTGKVGSRRPFYLTALGKAIAAYLNRENLETLLQNLQCLFRSPTPNSIRDLSRLKAELDLVKRQGYAIDNEEVVAGVRAIAAPIFKGTEK